MTRQSIAALLLLAALATTPAAAQAPQQAPQATEPEARAPEEMAREGVELLLRALRGFLEAVPQYGLPRIDDNGDIVIPRLRRDETLQPPTTEETRS